MKLETYLSQSGRKLTEIAEKVGCGPSTLHDLKTGRRIPSLGLAIKIKEATGGAVCPEDFAPAPSEVA